MGTNKEKQAVYNRSWQRKNHEKWCVIRKNCWLRAKRRVFALFGGCCLKCGNKDVRVLQLDHIAPTGTKRDTNFRSGKGLYYKILRDEEDLTQLQVLCANCHQIKTFENSDKRRKNKSSMKVENPSQEDDK